jgi:hypothetical protein
MWLATTDHGLHVMDKANMGFWPDEIKMYQHNFQNILEQTFFIGTLNAWLIDFKLEVTFCSYTFRFRFMPMVFNATFNNISVISCHSWEVYSIQHYVIKFVSDLRQVSGFLQVLQFPPPIQLTATIWLKYCWKWR